LIYYKWLADTATSAHVMHWHEAFITYTPERDQYMTEVGGSAKIVSQGTIELISICKGHKYIFCLEDVIHVPETQSNLISLG